MSSLVFIYLSSHYWSDLLPRYEALPPRASVGYVQTISNDVARASPRLMSPLISCVCHRSRHDIFLCGHKSIVTCTSQLRMLQCHLLVGQHSTPYNSVNLPFNLCGTLESHKPPEAWCTRL
jgi:hypothetical protein